MIRDFSEEKKEEIFRILDEIDMKEWKPFMEWCGTRVEEFGDWPEKLGINAHMRYVDEYHQRILDLNEMTRQQVNTVFENVAEIDARYAKRMRECQKKIKEQIAMVRTMSEFMQSMTDGNPNMALFTKGNVNESIKMKDKAELPVTSSGNTVNETNLYFLNDYFDSREEFDEEEIFRILEGALLSGDITQEEYDYLKELFTEMFDLTDETKIQSKYEEIEGEYNRITERNQYIQMYINEDFLRKIGFDIDALGIDDFVVELKRGLIQYDITGETSIQMFLANCMAETGGTDLLEIKNNNGDAGSGLIQVTGEAQYDFLRMVLRRYEEGSPEWEEIKAICRYFEDASGKYVGYSSTNSSGITPKEYIAEHYPIESAVWFWGEYKQCYTYYVPHEPDMGKDSHTINQYIELFEGMCAGREEDLFLAVQYYVNGASLKGPYLEDLCRNWCERDGQTYNLTYYGKNVLNGGSINSAPEEEISLETIKELAENGDQNSLEKIDITQVDYHGLNKPAPNGMKVRIYYYYYIQFLKGDL